MIWQLLQIKVEHNFISSQFMTDWLTVIFAFYLRKYKDQLKITMFTTMRFFLQ